jgi:hypothetical protein
MARALAHSASTARPKHRSLTCGGWFGVLSSCFPGVTHARKASSIKAITQEEAQRIIAEDKNRQRQHIGVSQ